MKATDMIKSLLANGFNQNSLANEINNREAPDIKTSQTQIFRILNGQTPSYDLGKAIERIYIERCENSERESA